MQNRQAMRKLMEDAVAEVTGAQPDHSRAVNIHHNFWCGVLSFRWGSIQSSGSVDAIFCCLYKRLNGGVEAGAARSTRLQSCQHSSVHARN